MEHTLGVQSFFFNMNENITVLILVLMEHTLGEDCENVASPISYVLILVLMEHTLGVSEKQIMNALNKRS